MSNNNYDNKIIGTRFSGADAELIQLICDARKEDTSSFIRRAVRREFARLGFMSETEKKALGMSEEDLLQYKSNVL